jgi:glycyl-tRNA synthetase beta chain
MKSDFLFELGTEELPPKALLSLSHAFTESILDGFIAQGLSFEGSTSYAAPRRLAIYIKGLDGSTPDSDIVSWGPPARVAFDEAGAPTKAAEAFASKNNLALSDLSAYIENDGHQDKLCIRHTESGRASTELFGLVINECLSSLPIPKRMRWGSSKDEFVRPVHWGVLMFGDHVCEETILGVKTGNVSQGHRFHCPGDILIKSPNSYEKQLRSAKVVAQFDERKRLIREGVSSLAKSIKGEAVIDESLLNEVTALNEWPVPLLGRFEKRFLSVPAEALISSMKEHQKYFHVINSKKELLPAFITVANIVSKDPKQVIAGNERVIRPRLADAAFFYENDATESLERRREALRKVVFQDKLGSVFDKTARVAAIAEALSNYTGADPSLARRAAELSKSDLVSDMVGEFADLQGTMGRYYALNDGEDKQVAEAQLEQYLPRFSGDQVPSTEVGTTLALADKLDTLVGIFSIGQQPSGSRDPFALRRASLGVLRIIIDRQIDLDLNEAILIAASQFDLKDEALEKIRLQVLTYILDRFKSWYKEEGLKAEVYLSVASLNLSNPLDIDARVKAISAFSKLPEAQDLAAANKRVSNLLSKQLKNRQPSEIDLALLEDGSEKNLANAIKTLSDVSRPLIEKRDYNAVLKNLATLRDPVDAFFNDVMVMSEDLAIRENRLSLLHRLRCLCINVADIAQMATSK